MKEEKLPVWTQKNEFLLKTFVSDREIVKIRNSPTQAARNPWILEIDRRINFKIYFFMSCSFSPNMRVYVLLVCKIWQCNRDASGHIRKRYPSASECSCPSCLKGKSTTNLSYDKVFIISSFHCASMKLSCTLSNFSKSCMRLQI